MTPSLTSPFPTQEVLRSSLGPAWQDNFETFDRLPFAAASIGQVHSAVLAAHASPTGEPAKVAVKIQFPNIANSIETDLGYVKMLLTAGRLLPRGLFLDRTIQVRLFPSSTPPCTSLPFYWRCRLADARGR